MLFSRIKKIFLFFDLVVNHGIRPYTILSSRKTFTFNHDFKTGADKEENDSCE